MTFPTWTSSTSLPCYGGPLIGDGVALQLHHPFSRALDSVLIDGKPARVRTVVTLATYGFDAAYALFLDRSTPFVPLLPASMFGQWMTSTWARPDGTTRGGYFVRSGLSIELPPLAPSDQNYASGSAFYSGGYCVGVFKSANMLVCPPAPPAVAASALSADFNGDGKVDFADHLTLSRNYGKPGDHAHGDATGDGRVDFSDLLELSKQYGRKA